MPRSVQALFDFPNAEPGQLTFSSGDVIVITQEGAADAWWEGELRGVVGWFPSSYCSPPFSDGLESHEAGPTGGGPSAIRAVALYAYQGGGPDELTFVPGDVIDVSDASQSWWTGTLRGATGVFPGNYVEVMADHSAEPYDDGAAKPAPPPPAGLFDLSKALGAAVAKHKAEPSMKGTPDRDSGRTDVVSAEASVSTTTATFTVSASNASNWEAAEKEAAGRDGAAMWDKKAEKHGGDIATAGYMERPMSTSHKAGSRPTWQHAAYSDLFAAPYRASDTEASAVKRMPPLISLVTTMDLISRAATHLETECDAGSPAHTAIGRVCHALNEAQKTVTMVPTTRLADDSMADFLGRLVPSIKQTAVGATLLIPINLSHASDTGDGSTQEAEAVILAAQRRTMAPGRFSFAVISGGQALRYHAHSVGETTAAFEHHAALVLEHVPEQRLCDSAWWYLLFRAQLVNTGASSLQGPSGVAQLAQAQDAKEAAKAAAVVANQAAKAAAKAGKAGYKALKNELRAGYNKAMNKDKDKGPNDGLLPPAPNEPDHGIKDGARFLYETLLPFLNCRALLANVTTQTVDWAALPAGGHAVAPSHVATEAARFVMRGTAGLSSSHADQLLLLLRWTILRMADAELRNLNTVAPSDDALLRASCRHLAALATELSPPLPPTILTSILSTFSSISSRLDSLAIATNATKSDRTRAPLTLPTSASAPGGSMFPFVGRLRRDFPIDHLAGESRPSPILIPCELTLIPHLVNSYDEAAHALRRCEQQCTLLNNQMQLLRNSVQLRLALIQHTLIELLPIPLPTANCFWQSHPMRVETQGDLLRTLHRLSRALHAASFSLTNTPSLDAARMTTSAAIACLVDAILRARVEDAPTLFCMHYSGRAGGPTSPFGFSLGAYDDESDSAPILSAALALARPRLLYYMAAMDSQLQVP